MLTLENAVDRFGVDVLDHLEREATIPIVDFGRQGDVIVTPHRIVPAGKAYNIVPAAGIPVVRGENGGNTHLLIADGPVYFDVRTDGLALGTLSVPDGSTAYLAHPEHGYIGFTTGDYTISRQREQADEIRVVTD